MSKGTLETDEAILGLFIDFLSILDVVFLHEALLLKVNQNQSPKQDTHTFPISFQKCII